MQYKNAWTRLHERAACVKEIKENSFEFDDEKFKKLKNEPDIKQLYENKIMNDERLKRSCRKCYKWVKDFNAYNESIANSIGQLAPQMQDIKGRDEELKLLQAVMERPITPVAILLGMAGVGKSAIVEEFSKQAALGELTYHAGSRNYMVLTLRLGALSGLQREQLQKSITNLLNDLSKFEKQAQVALYDVALRFVLFIDEIHMIVTIFGSGSKLGGDLMKDLLARAPIRVIGATTQREYDSTIAVDKPLAERFKTIELKEVDSDTVRAIAKNWWKNVAPDCPKISDNVIDFIINTNKAYRPDDAEPRKTLDILEDMVSYCRRTGKEATNDDVIKVFHDRFSIEIGFRIDADKVYENIKSSVLGQPYALRAWRLMLYGTAFKTHQNTNKPIMTAFLAGPTAVGKTSTVKALSETLYPHQNALYTMNMTDFQSDLDEPRFRKNLGEILRHKPNAVVMFDEFEKASDAIRNSLLYILDEGLVNFTVLNREGREETNTASLRDSIVLCTSNAGSKVFNDDNRFSNVKNIEESDSDYGISLAQEMEVERLNKSLRKDLIENNFRPELLGRFDEIIAYRALSQQTMLQIIDRKLKAMVEDLKTNRGIEIVLNPAVKWYEKQYNCVANDVVVYLAFMCLEIDDSDSGGVRAIDSEIQMNVFYRIVQAVLNNKDCKKFKIGVNGVYSTTQREGSKMIEVYGLDNEVKEGVYVEPIIETES